MLQQGVIGALSEVLFCFNHFDHNHLEHYNRQATGININGHKTLLVMYADDIIILANFPQLGHKKFENPRRILCSIQIKRQYRQNKNISVPSVKIAETN